MYSAKMFRDNIKGTTDFFANYIYPHPALQPEYHNLAGNFSTVSISAPKIKFVSRRRLHVKLDESLTEELINQVAIYKMVKHKWMLVKVGHVEGHLTNKKVGVKLPKGRYAATLIDRFGREGSKTYFKV